MSTTTPLAVLALALLFTRGWQFCNGFGGVSVVGESRRFTCTTGSVLFAATEGSKEGRKPTPAQRAIQQSASQDFNNFDKIKQAMYGAVDGIPRIGENDATDNKSRIIDGYSEIQKRITPAEQLMRVRNNPSKSSTPSNVFDAVKNAVYGTADLTSSVGDRILSNSDRRQSIVAKEKVPIKRSLSQDIIDSIPDLKSVNPMKRLAAEAKLKNLEIEAETRRKQKEIEDSVNRVKQTVYDTGDAITGAIETIKSVPTVLNEAVFVVNEAVENAKTIPSQVTKRAQEVNLVVQTTVEDITAIPSKVEAKISEVQRLVDETIENTKQFIEDVKAVPSRIEQSVDNTKRTIDNTIQTVDEVKTNTKILLGLEKPKPKPPKIPPPKQKTVSDYAFQALGTVASVTGKAAFWVGKGAADLTVKAATVGFEAAKESISKKQKETSVVKESNPSKTFDSTKREETVPAVVSESQYTEVSIEVPSSPAIETTELEKDIEEALKLATDALQAPTSAISSDSEGSFEKSENPVTSKKKSKSKSKSKSKPKRQKKSSDIENSSSTFE
jgi:hypothetical protein